MLFYLDKTDRTALRALPGTTLKQLGWNEKDLEDLVAQHIDRILSESQLFVIHQQRPRQEEPDIMALDRDGHLHIFELKRWRSDAENLLQVLRYGQRFGQHDYRELNYVFTKYTQREGGTAPATDLAEAHKVHFDLDAALEREHFNREQVFVVMTNGLDRATRDALAYWGGQGLPVRPLVYRVYTTAGHDLLFEIEPYGTEVDTVDADDQARGLVVVNTNRTYDADAWRTMLKEGKASAFGSRKTAVDRISRGDAVALFHSGVGVIALGRATSDVRVGAAGADNKEEHYVTCEFEYVADPMDSPDLAVTAREINENLEASHRFRQTVYTLPAEAVEFIRGRFQEKGTPRGPKR